jgi:hypothetical protein
MARIIIAENQVGTRLINGTEWPVMDQIVRDQRPGQRTTWMLVRGECNGIPEGAQEYRTRREAQAAFGLISASEPDTDELGGAPELFPVCNAYGWSVTDMCGGRWWPDDEATAEIEASGDPAATVLRICTTQPMRGEWHQ